MGVEAVADAGGAPRGFSRYEAAGRGDGDALVFQRIGVGDFLLDLGGLVGDGGGQRKLIALEVLDGGLQSGDGGCVLVYGLVGNRGSGIGLIGGGLGIGRGLLRLLQLGVFGGQIGFKFVDLPLEFLAQLLNLLLDRRRLWLPGLFVGLWGCGVLLHRRICVLGGGV